MVQYRALMSPRQALAVVGAFGIDTNVYAAGDRLGAEMTFARTTDGLGQAGCYSALASAALGVSTRAIAALGDDRLGRWVAEELRAAGIEVVELRDPSGTHRSVNIVSADGARRNYFDPRGVSETVVDVEACREALRDARVTHIHLDDWCRRLLPLAQEAGVRISCDLQDVVDVDDPYRADFVAAADVLFLSGTNLEDPAAAALELAGRRPGRLVVVGVGAHGCLTALDGVVRRHAGLDLPGHPVIDTNGAGDNLAVGLLVGYLFDGLTLDAAVQRAQLGARWICSQPGDGKQPATRERLAALAELAV
jgi:sugar/nucleoside kinase (ribokinase family)